MMDPEIGLGAEASGDGEKKEVLKKDEPAVELDTEDMECPKCNKQLIWTRNFLMFEKKFHGLMSKVCSNEKCNHITGQFKKCPVPDILARRAAGKTPEPHAGTSLDVDVELARAAGPTTDPMDDPDTNAYITDILKNGSPVSKVKVVMPGLQFYKYMATLSEEDFIKELTTLFPNGVPNLVKILDED